MHDTPRHFAALAAAHDEYMAKLATVQRIAANNPNGLCIKPLFGQERNAAAPMRSGRTSEARE